MIIPTRFYQGPYKAIAVLIVLSISIAGFFVPAAGLVVIAMMLLALAINTKKSRAFCASVCPNGRAFSAVMPLRKSAQALPRAMASKEFRRALCGFMLFCMLSLTMRAGGTAASIGRVFWMLYLASVGISTIMGLFFKPRAWCAICPMGTLQDTMNAARAPSLK